jgi:phospholipid/cholesterol/gamma-HCH transport system substrate-binding protein
MSTESKVGVFMVISLLVLGAAVYFVRTTQTVKGQVEFKTYLRYAGGLAQGTTVLFGGIKVGQVTSVHPSTEDPTRIEIGFEVKTGTPINEDSRARIGSLSLMTSPVLSITTGSNGARLLKRREVVGSEETIGMEDVTRRVAVLADSLNQLITELRVQIPELTGEAKTLLGNLNEITGKTNQRSIEHILTEFDTLLNQESPKIAQITDQVLTLAKHADSVVVSVEPLVANTDRTMTNVNSTIDAIREPLTKNLTELQQTIQSAKTLLASIQNIVQTNDTDISEMIQNLRSTSENLQELTDSVKQRPWSLIRIKQAPDRKVPK